MAQNTSFDWDESTPWTIYSLVHLKAFIKSFAEQNGLTITEVVNKVLLEGISVIVATHPEEEDLQDWVKVNEQDLIIASSQD